MTPSTSADLQGALNIPVQQYCPSASTSHGQLPSSAVVLSVLPLVLDTEQPSPPPAEAVDCGQRPSS